MNKYLLQIKFYHWYYHSGLTKPLRLLRRRFQNSWPMKLAREFAKAYYESQRHGIDFGPEPIKNLAKYYCAQQYGRGWYSKFIWWPEFRRKMDWYYEMEMYE